MRLLFPHSLIPALALSLALTAAAVAQDSAAPDVDADVPATEVPEADVPATGAQAPEAPAGETPAAETPETDAPTAPEAEGGAAPAEGAAEGEAAPGDPAGPEILEIVRDTFGDWQVRCAPDGADCFMYQLARDSDDNPVAEVSILKLPADAEAAAGVTVVTPLGTLLTEGVALQIDTGQARQYPFSWCSQVGCFARFGLTDDSVAAMKRGNSGQMRLASIGAPEQPLALALSLTGFTAAYDSLVAPTGPQAPDGLLAPTPPLAPDGPLAPTAPLAPDDAPASDAPLAPAN